MGRPVVHFEIVGPDAAALRAYYAQLFDWRYDTDSPVAPEVSDAGDYGFIDAATNGTATNGTASDSGAPAGIPGGVGGGPGRAPHAVFYVAVDDVEAALAEAERLGGARVMGPAANPNGSLVVGHFTDPQGNLVGVAGPR
ncbi:VOC family protein [Herbiconiux daphne]|uniref:VOC family protein n=1 Tax=Herbiconiux daphne TaxID=2970914 RepID=A0ABT2GW08_9MICO|nr:VOC family protein [Herbiconiux daphne]MCS5732144.1 VOC family protein [Herbiconiux daphne]